MADFAEDYEHLIPGRPLEPLDTSIIEEEVARAIRYYEANKQQFDSFFALRYPDWKPPEQTPHPG